MKERVSISGPINVTLLSQLLTIDPSTPTVKHKWEYVGLRPGKYFFEVSLEYGEGFHTRIPFEVFGEKVSGWIRVDPPDIHIFNDNFRVDLKKQLIQCIRDRSSSYEFAGRSVYLRYSTPPKYLKQG
ncbi:hypothetical protein, partial [Paenibacillus jilunlii]|uniref:hypothetical protein n=1 Tax=Paenibacillus jilunlii TaxID=682956 RepID=UPI001B807712